MAKAVDSFYNVSVEYSILHLDPGAVADGRRAIPLEYKDYYETLKVKKDASQDEIQKAYRKLARKFHPDVNKASDSERRFKEIGEAYEVLKDPEKRKKYDQFGAAWKQSGGTHQVSYADPVTGERKSVSVKIPAGVRSGQRIRLAGRGLGGSDGGE